MFTVTADQELSAMIRSLEWSWCDGKIKRATEDHIARLRLAKARQQKRAASRATRAVAVLASLLIALTASAITFEDVMYGIRQVETGSREYFPFRAIAPHRDGVSWWDYGITYIAVRDCQDNGYVTPWIDIDLGSRDVANYCARQYLCLLTNRWGSLWAATCRWNKGREDYAAKVWAAIDRRKK